MKRKEFNLIDLREVAKEEGWSAEIPEDFLKEMYQEQMKILSDERDKGIKKCLTNLFHIVNKECKPRTYLQNIGKEITKQLKFKQLTPQQLVQKISDRACAYYHAIWAICSSWVLHCLYL